MQKNIRQTSINCFNQITKEGLLSKCRLALYELGKPSTAREIFSTMQVVKMEATRLTELMNMGVIYERGIRNCAITGRKVIEWDSTDNLPKDLQKINRKDKVKILKGMIAELQLPITRLKLDNEIEKIQSYIDTNF
jgi:hypothetical protein